MKRKLRLSLDINKINKINFKTALIGLMIFCFTGCGLPYVVGHYFKFEPDKIIKGKTTRAEIFEYYGTPNLYVSLDKSNEAVVYSYSVGPPNEYELGLLIVIFDKNNIVQDYYIGFQNLQTDEKIPTCANVSSGTAQIIKQLIESSEGHEKISALDMALSMWSPFLREYLVNYSKNQIEVEKDPQLLAMYYLTLDKAIEDNHREETEFGRELLKLLSSEPLIFNSFEKNNPIALAMLIEFLKARMEQCDKAAVNFVFSNTDKSPYDKIFKSDAEEFFKKRTNCVLDYFIENDGLNVEKTVTVFGIKPSVDNPIFLKLYYYSSENDDKYGNISKRFIEIIEKK
jgi:hypothetical protein